MIKLNDEVNQLAGEPQATSGGMVFLFSLITCGIYGIYWAYKMGERCDRIRGIQGNSSILYLVLSILGLDIVYFCLLQDMINKRYLNAKRIHRNSCYTQVFYASSFFYISITSYMETSTANKFSQKRIRWHIVISDSYEIIQEFQQPLRFNIFRRIFAYAKK